MFCHNIGPNDLPNLDQYLSLNRAFTIMKHNFNLKSSKIAEWQAAIKSGELITPIEQIQALPLFTFRNVFNNGGELIVNCETQWKSKDFLVKGIFIFIILFFILNGKRYNGNRY